MSSEHVFIRRLPEQVADSLCEEIFSGALPPESTLPTEPELCVRFGVSRTVVREAVRLLVSKGLVEVRHGSGMRVRPQAMWDLLDPQVLFGRLQHERNFDLLAEILEVRRIIEIEVAGLAARRRTDEDLVQLRALLVAMQAALHDADAYTALDYEFHEMLLRAACNRLLIEILRPVAEVLRAARCITNRRARSLTASQRGHIKLVNAIAAKDVDAARDAMQRHIVQFEQDIRRSFDA
ncbi:MAG: FadR/GntR family transcriptional regulator [Chloroflexi bacterium]|nr:FadR/GntR family transcriptional regulator [Chloroflexota bacterium]